MLVASDSLTDKDYPAISMVKGDIFMIVGASLYGFSMFPISLTKTFLLICNATQLYYDFMMF